MSSFSSWNGIKVVENDYFQTQLKTQTNTSEIDKYLENEIHKEKQIRR